MLPSRSDVLQHDLVLIDILHLGHSLGGWSWIFLLWVGGIHRVYNTCAGERSVCHAGCSGGGLVSIQLPKVLLSPSCLCASSWSCSCLCCCAHAPARYWSSFNCPSYFHWVKWVSEMVLALRPEVSQISWWAAQVFTQLVCIHGWSKLQSWGRGSALLPLTIQKFADPRAFILSMEKVTSSARLRGMNHLSTCQPGAWCTISADV